MSKPKIRLPNCPHCQRPFSDDNGEAKTALTYTLTCDNCGHSYMPNDVVGGRARR